MLDRPYLGNDEVLLVHEKGQCVRWDAREREENLNIHQVIHADASELRELLSTLL